MTWRESWKRGKIKMKYETKEALMYLGKILLVCALGIGALSLSFKIINRDKIKFHKLSPVIEMDSAYKSKQDSLYSNYLFEKDSLKLDYQIKLNQLERGLK